MNVGSWASSCCGRSLGRDSPGCGLTGGDSVEEPPTDAYAIAELLADLTAGLSPLVAHTPTDKRTPPADKIKFSNWLQALFNREPVGKALSIAAPALGLIKPLKLVVRNLSLEDHQRLRADELL